MRAAALSTRRDRYGIAKFLWSFVDKARDSQAFCNAVSLFFLILLQPPDVVELPMQMARRSQISAQSASWLSRESANGIEQAGARSRGSAVSLEECSDR